MKQIKFVSLAFAFFLSSTFFLTASAKETHSSKPLIPETISKKITQSRENKNSPFIQIIWLYTTCPNGKQRAVGAIGLTDSGQYIDSMYWGEALACENDQLIHYA